VSKRGGAAARPTPAQRLANAPVSPRRRLAPTLGTMNETPGAPDPANRMEASLAVRKAHREATSQAGDLADRLAEVDLHQREARYLLERAGMLERRRRRRET
jgi:hypothetical protein